MISSIFTDGYEEMLAALRISNAPECWSSQWKAMRELYAHHGEDFLTDASLDDIFSTCLFPADVQAPLIDAVKLVRCEPALFSLAWFWHAMLIYNEGTPEYDFKVAEWPLPEHSMGEMAAMFPAVVILSCFADLFVSHRARQISPAVTRSTCSDLSVWIRHYRSSHGSWGFSNILWLVNHCRGKIFRIGRLQFRSIPYGDTLRAYKHRVSGQVLALVEAGVTFRNDGLVDGTNYVFDPQAWVSRMEIGEQTVRGHPIMPTGFARRETVELSREEWDEKLGPGDQVLDIHIPEDGKMSHELCGESLTEAEAFFRRHFPELTPPAAFVCYTWLLDYQLKDILPPSSNIVRFQREFYLSPVLSHQDEALRRIFGSPPDDITKVPCKTSLAKAVQKFILDGNALRCGRGFILREDLNWGSQCYQQKVNSLARERPREHGYR